MRDYYSLIAPDVTTAMLVERINGGNVICNMLSKTVF